MIDRPAAPQRPPRRDWFAPAVVAGSLVLHAGLVAPLVWAPRAEAARPPAETPIEVVQLPPEPEKPKPETPKPPVPKTKPPEPPRQAQAKPSAPKPPTPKPPAPKPPAPKAQAARPPAPRPQAGKLPAPKPLATKPEKAPEKSVAKRMEQLIGPMAAMAMPALGAGDNSADDSVSYRQLVLSRVAKQKREERHDGIPGHAVITFTVGDGGEVLTCEVREKSVDPALDAEAVAMVYRGAPYPAPPPGAERRFSFGLGFHTL